MQTKTNAQRLELKTILCFLLASLLCSSAQAQSTKEQVFDSVPTQLRERLVERLKLLVDYQRTQQWEKQYNLLSELVSQGQSKSEFVKLNRHYYSEVVPDDLILDFTPKSVTAHSESVDYGRNDLDVTTTKFAGHGRLVFSQNAVGEVIHLRGLLVDGRVVQRATTGITNDAAIGKRMFLKLEPAFVTFDAKLIRTMVETGYSLALCAVGKVHGPANCLFNSGMQAALHRRQTFRKKIIHTVSFCSLFD